MIIRTAKKEDVPVLTQIYNYAVIETTSTFDLEPKTIEERMLWFEDHKGIHPLIVAELEGKVVGYASLSMYRPKQAYVSTVELSMYVHGDHQRQGVGKMLMTAILNHAREIPTIHTVISVITSGNDASDLLHRQFGFVKCGVIKEAGRKFGRYLDIVTYQLMLNH